MRIVHLNLDAIRESCRGTPATGRAPLTVSRRQMLGISAVATVGTSPALKLLERFGARIEVRGDGHRVAFLLDGSERWILDTRRFAGHPSLSIEKRDGLVRVTLTGARYPGTDLPADLVAELRNGMLSPRISIRMSLGRFRGEMAAEKFLSGISAMRSSVSLGARTEQLAVCTSMTLNGKAAAAYRPDWTLSMKGSHLAALTTPSGRLLSDVVVLALLSPEHPSVFTRVPPLRSRITIRRGDLAWILMALLPTRVERHGATPGGLLDGTFDAVHLELGEQQKALIAEANGEHVALTFQPDGVLLDMDDQPFRFALQNPRFVCVFGRDATRGPRRSSASLSLTTVGMRNGGNPSTGSLNGQKGIVDTRTTIQVAGDNGALQRGSETEVQSYISRNFDEWALVARFHSDPAWLRTEAFALEIGDGPGARLFELTGKGNKTQLTYAPALRRMVTPVAGAITEPVAPKTPVRLELHHSRVRPKPQKGVLHVRTYPARNGLHELYSENLTVSLVRPQDLLAVTLELTNVTLQYGAGPPTLIPDFSTLVAHFPPQHLGEQAFNVGANEKPPAAGFVQALAAGPSRLAFSIPQSVTQIPYTLESLLNWSDLIPSITATGQPHAGQYTSQFIMPPGDTETSIEAPYRLMLSPNDTARWAHSIGDVTHGGVTELWHTRLGVAQGNAIDEVGHRDLRTMRAVWSPDYTTGPVPNPYPGAGEPFRMSLDGNTRDQIVRLTSDYYYPAFPASPGALNVDRLMLSSLGAWMDVHGVWNVSGLTLGAWRHRMAMGRDTYVRYANRGYLYPFGQPALFVTETARKPSTSADGKGNDFVLFQRQFIVVVQPERVYDATDVFAGFNPGNNGRKVPYKRVRVTTLTTPSLNPPGANGAGGGILIPNDNGMVPADLGKAQIGFWPTANGARVPFGIVAIDQNGNTVEFSTPLVFLSSDVAEPTNPTTGGYANDHLQLLDGVAYVYARDAGRMADMAGQNVALAPKSSVQVGIHANAQTPADTSVSVQQLEHASGKAPAPPLPGTPYFFPTMASAMVTVPALAQITGNATPAKVVYSDAYIQHALDAQLNPAQMFLNFPDFNNQPSLNFVQNTPGLPVISPGVVSPNMVVTGLSAVLGTTGGDPANMASGVFDPSSVFNSLGNTLILGAIPLKNLFGNNLIKDLTNMPSMVKKQLPDAIDYTYSWSTPFPSFHPFLITSVGHNGDDPPLPTGDPSALTISASIHVPTPLNGGPAGPPTYQIQGTLSNFLLAFEVIALPFKKLQFTIENGQKFSAVPDVGEIEFIGLLSFLEGIKEFLSQFLDPPYLDVQIDHVQVGYTLGIPNIPMGAWTFQNIKVGAGIFIPYFGDPVRATFDFGTRADPFLLTVELLGGGGHFGLGLSPRGIETVEAQVELGASVDIDLVICEAAARVMLGIDVSWNVQSGQGILAAFFDIGATVTLLGLLTVGIDIQIGLGYDTATSKFVGEAMLQVEVGAGPFDKTVTLGPVRKEFPIAAKPPIKPPIAAGHLHRHVVTSGATIQDVLTQADWTEYCAAFA